MKIKMLLYGGLISNALGLAGSIWGFGFLHFSTAMLFLNIGILIFLLLASNNLLLGLSQGLGSKEVLAEEVIKEKLASMLAFTDEIKFAVSEIKEIGNTKFTEVLNLVKNENIRGPLLLANEKIMDIRSREIASTWVAQGVASVTGLKQKENDLTAYANQVILNIVKYLNANQGGFFLLKKESDGEYLELIASYAYGRKKYLQKKINAGEGLLGQVVFEKEIIYLTEVPQDYITITSGLGEALPRCICIVPLIAEGKVLGAFEIASFEKLGSKEREYLQKISETIGYHLGAIETQSRTAALLKESQQMGQELRSQEEELRQNMEELTATQEQMGRKQAEMDTVLASLSTVELDMSGMVTNANEIFLGITGYKVQDIVGKIYKSLIPQHGNDPIQYEMMWQSIQAGRAFSGEFRIVNKAQKEMWTAGNFTPIKNESGHPYKVMVISLFTSQDKEKLFELQEMVAAIKGSFAMAEITQDMTFKSASEPFLTELGIKRIELKKLLPVHVFSNGSFEKVAKYSKNHIDQPLHEILELKNKEGQKKHFNSTLIKLGNGNGLEKKTLLILSNPVQMSQSNGD
jgi:PAS domain S-box-containing protein